ncbi:MAG TPA: HD domain-containing phosphohydrolase, partial [Solirubrobacteraceae bacterium]
PAGRGPMMSGPEIQANAIQTALDGFPLRGTPGWLTAAFAALLGFAAPYARRRVSVLTAALAAAGLAAAWALGALLAFTMGLVVPVAAPLAAIGLGVVAMVVVSHLDESLARRRIAGYSTELEALVRERTRELRETQLEVVQRLAQAAELRDDQTGGHIERIGRLCGLLAEAAGMSRERAELVAQASVMHDVGKIGIPDRILLKPDRLDDLEWQAMKAHTTSGARLLAGSGSDIVRLAEQIALTHHERWDGTGYPAGLRGEEIPLAGRICAICDVFDALVSARPYKPAWPLERAIAEIRAGAGTHFDPALVEPFIAIVRERAAPQALAA